MNNDRSGDGVTLKTKEKVIATYIYHICYRMWNALRRLDNDLANYLNKEDLITVFHKNIHTGQHGGMISPVILGAIEELPAEVMVKLEKFYDRMGIFLVRGTVDQITNELKTEGHKQLSAKVGELWQCADKDYDANKKKIETLLGYFIALNEGNLLRELLQGDGALSESQQDGEQQEEHSKARMTAEYIKSSAQKALDSIDKPDVVKTQIYKIEGAIVRDGVGGAIDQTAMFDELAKTACLCVQYAVCKAGGDKAGMKEKKILIEQAIEDQLPIYRENPYGSDDIPMYSDGVAAQFRYEIMDVIAPKESGWSTGNAYKTTPQLTDYGKRAQEELQMVEKGAIDALVTLHKARPDTTFGRLLAMAAEPSLREYDIITSEEAKAAALELNGEKWYSNKAKSDADFDKSLTMATDPSLKEYDVITSEEAEVASLGSNGYGVYGSVHSVINITSKVRDAVVNCFSARSAGETR